MRRRVERFAWPAVGSPPPLAALATRDATGANLVIANPVSRQHDLTVAGGHKAVDRKSMSIVCRGMPSKFNSLEAVVRTGH